MNQIVSLCKGSTVLLLFCIISLFLVACDQPRDTASNESPTQSLETPEQAAARLRSLYFAQDRFTGSLEAEKLLATFPNFPELVAWQVLNLSRSGDYKSATDYADALIRSNPSDPWGKFAFAAALFWNHQTGSDEVLDATHAALLANPHHPDFIWLHAEALRVGDRRDESLSLLNQQGTILESSPELLNVKASALFGEFLANRADLSKLSFALTTFDRARQVNPRNVNSHFLAGKFLLQLQRPAEAYPLVKTAASLSAATPVQIAYWGAVLKRRDLPLADQRAEIDDSIERFLPNKMDDYDFLWAAADTYRELDMPAKQSILEDRVLASDPEGPVAEVILMSRIDAMAREDGGDSRRFRDGLRDFLRRESHHSMRLFFQAQRMLFDVLKDDADANPEELLGLVQDMSHGTAVTRTLAYSEGIVALASHKTLLRQAEEMAKTGLGMISEVSTGDSPDGADLRPGENVPLLIEGAIRDGLGLVYFNQGRDREAEQEWLTAYQILSNRQSILLHLAELYESRMNFARAESFYLECAALPEIPNHPCSIALREYYVRRHGGAEGLETFLGSIDTRLDRKRKEQILKSKLPGTETPPAIELKSLDGEMASLTEMDGKLTVMHFWGLWCEPCLLEMPAFARFAERYSDVDDVEIIAINNDPNPDIVREWMENSGYKFSVLFDDGHSFNEDLSGIPSAWFIDRNGRKVFELLGMIGNLEQEYAARIELMRAMAN